MPVSDGNPNNGLVLRCAVFKKGMPGFQDSHMPVEVQAMLALLMKLHLQTYHVPEDDSLLVDSCMLKIKASITPDIIIIIILKNLQS